MANVFEVLRTSVRTYGVDRLAGQTGQSEGVIYNKINNNESSHHKPTLADFIVWQLIIRDNSALHALAHALGEVCFPVPNLAHCSDSALIELLLRVGEKEGAFCSSLNDALADRRFTRAEFERVKANAYQAIGALAETIARVEGLVDA